MVSLWAGFQRPHSKNVCKRNNKKNLKDRRVLDSGCSHAVLLLLAKACSAHTPNKQCKLVLKSIYKLSKIIQQVAVLNPNLVTCSSYS